MFRIQNTKNLAVTLTLCFVIHFVTGQDTKNRIFTASEISLQTATGNIYGTLTVPNRETTCSVVLIIAGSGPTDRDGNNTFGLKTDTYKQLAECLAKKGIASLRYDKRGIAASKEAMKSEKELIFENYIEDAKAWISLLKSDNRFSKIIILGHSEGSLIGMVAAQQTVVDQFISIAGIGRPADKVLQEQLKGKLPAKLEEESDRVLDSLLNGIQVTSVSKELYSLYRPSVQPYMISWLKYDPAVEIKKLSIPVLIIQGTTDIQVSVNDAQLLSAAKPDAECIIIKNMNHVLKKSSSALKENMDTYAKPELPLMKGLTKNIILFIENH